MAALRTAVRRAREVGLTGTNLLGSGMNFEFVIKEGAGAFVCGEETALMHSIEARRGVPRMRPPFPAIVGLWGRPTNINNVETFASVPSILLHGPGWFSDIGSARSGGTKALAMTGSTKRAGLVEVSIGMTLGEILNGSGDGCKEGRTLKAVQLGGPAGGCVPAELFDTAIDYEELRAMGAIMGSGGMVAESHPVISYEVIRAVKRGATLIVIDPRRIPLARHASLFLQTKSGADIHVFLAMMNVILRNGWADAAFIATRTEGFEDFAASIEDYRP